MKKLSFILILFTVAFVYLTEEKKIPLNKTSRKLTHKNKIILKQKEIKIIQKVPVTQAATKKKAHSQNNQHKKLLVEKISQSDEFKKINQSIKETFLKKSKNNQNSKKFQKIKSYIERFDFDTELKKEFSKLDIRDLKSIVELEHPIDSKLKKVEKQNKELIDKIIEGEDFINDDQKQQVIDYIISETNAVEATEIFYKNILESTYYHAIKKHNHNLNEAEVIAKVSELTNQKLNENESLIKRLFNVTYGQLSTEELTEYYHFLQKSDAKSATKLSLNAQNKVMKRFINGLFNL